MTQKAPTSLFSVLLVLALLLGAVYFTTDILSVSGTPVLVDFENLETNPDGYTGKFYVGDVALDGDTSTYRIIPKSGPSDSLEFQIGWTESKVQVPLISEGTPIQYKYHSPWLGLLIPKKADVPYFNLDMNNRKVVTKATVKVDPVAGATITKYLSNEIDADSNTFTSQQFVVKDENGIPRTIYIRYNNLNFISGDLAIATPMSVVKQGSAPSYQLVRHADLQRAMEHETGWNEYVFPFCVQVPGRELCRNLDMKSWNGVYDWMMDYDKIPPVNIGSASSHDIELGSGAKIDIHYPSTVFAPSVTFYVPEELGFMIIVEQAPEFKIDPISTIHGIEGGTSRITITGTATGTGSIDLDVDSPAVHSVSWDGGSLKNIEKGKDYTYSGTLRFNVGLDAGKYFDAKLECNALGFGQDTTRDFRIYLTDKDTTNTHDLRVHAIYKGTSDTVETAELYAGYDVFIGYGDNTRQDLPVGSYAVYSDNVTGWYSEYTREHPKTVNLDKDTTVVIEFTEEPPVDGLAWYYYLIFGIIVLAFIGLILQELGVKIETNHILILLAIIIFAGLVWYGISTAERLIEALDNLNPFEGNR